MSASARRLTCQLQGGYGRTTPPLQQLWPVLAFPPEEYVHSLGTFNTNQSGANHMHIRMDPCMVHAWRCPGQVGLRGPHCSLCSLHSYCRQQQYPHRRPRILDRRHQGSAAPSLQAAHEAWLLACSNSAHAQSQTPPAFGHPLMLAFGQNLFSTNAQWHQPRHVNNQCWYIYIYIYNITNAGIYT